MRKVLTESFIQKAKVKVLDLVEATEQVKASLPALEKSVVCIQRPREKRWSRALKMM